MTLSRINGYIDDSANYANREKSRKPNTGINVGTRTNMDSKRDNEDMFSSGVE